MCLCAYMHSHMNASAHDVRCQMPLGLQVGVSHLMWVLEITLRFSGKPVHALNH